jgi:hypothetical protein
MAALYICNKEKSKYQPKVHIEEYTKNQSYTTLHHHSLIYVP